MTGCVPLATVLLALVAALAVGAVTGAWAVSIITRPPRRPRPVGRHRVTARR
jgi:hypothetical protein